MVAVLLTACALLTALLLGRWSREPKHSRTVYRRLIYGPTAHKLEVPFLTSAVKCLSRCIEDLLREPRGRPRRVDLLSFRRIAQLWVDEAL